jgi:hypothetical protein
MKKSHYLRLLAYEPFILLAILLYGVFFAYLLLSLHREDETFILGFIPAGSFADLLIPLSLIFVFKIPPIGIKNPQLARHQGELEFFFTRAISRRSIFYAKATRYLLACLLPFLATWAFSCARPLIRVEAPYEFGRRAAMEQFYFTHYYDAHLQTAPYKDIVLTYVVLPHGHMNMAFFTFAWVCFATLLFQFIFFLFWGKFRAMVAVFAAFIIVPCIVLEMLLSSNASSIINPAPTFTPSFYESSLAWVTVHAALTLLILVLTAIVTQTYCCHRYINTEITT